MSHIEYHTNKYYSHPLSPKKSVIDIPPRKLLARGARPAPLDDMSSPRSFSSAASADENYSSSLLQRFLPCNGGDDEEDVDPYASDHFRMFEFKVRRCTRSRSHDWTDCPFAHPGEKARRRDPRRYHYSGTVCPEYRRGGCSRGDSCEFAHGVFECWLHPARYRTEACKDGRSCKRKVCFFAHTARQLRVLPEAADGASPAAASAGNNKHHRNGCLLCCHATSSPTSTLFGPMSPPGSPMKPRSLAAGLSLSPFSRFLNSPEHPSPQTGGPQVRGPQFYKDTLSELVCSLEAMRFSDAASGASGASGGGECRNYGNALWADQQQQFVLSPSTSNGSNYNYDYDYDVAASNNANVNNVGSSSCDPDHPDLGWVNDLLT